MAATCTCFLFPPGEAARSASPPADQAGASCTLRARPWSCRTTTQKVRPVTSTRHSRRSPSKSKEAGGSNTAGYAGSHMQAPPWGLLQIWGTGELRDSFLRDQLCLKASWPTHTSPASDLGTIAPLFLYIYIYTKPTHIKQIASSLHLFSIYPPRDHFIIHVKRTLFQTNCRPAASRWVMGPPSGCRPVALHALSYRQLP